VRGVIGTCRNHTQHPKRWSAGPKGQGEPAGRWCVCQGGSGRERKIYRRLERGRGVRTRKEKGDRRGSRSLQGGWGSEGAKDLGR